MILNIPGRKVTGLPGLLTVLFIATFLLFKPSYLNTEDLYFWIGLLSLPLSYKIWKEDKSNRFFWMGLGFALLTIIFPTTFGVYCILIFSILFTIEQLKGKTDFLFTFHLLLLSPLFQYFSSLISFPIRLALSGAAGNMLKIVGFDIQINGNLMKLDGVDFLVDSACSGLFMLRYAFLFAVIILTHFQSHERPWRMNEIISLFAALFLFNILGNLVRIIILIVFKIMPDFWFHEVMGLFIFLIYSLLPFYFLAKWWSKRKKAVRSKTSPSSKSFSPTAFSYALGFLLLSLTIASWKNNSRTANEVRINEETRLTYQAEKVNGSVYKLQSEKALIYIKPPVEPYHADHNPLICWKGSGYEFKHISTTTIGELEVSVAELTKETDTLYTMWWFDSGKYQTASQWTWRWRSLSREEDFYLVNVTAESRETVRQETKNLLEENIIGEQTIYDHKTE